MERIEHDLHQGEDDWHAFRLDHFGASELVFALGLSKKESRTGLLHAKKTGIARQFSQWLQENVLDRGHELEASARPIVARLIGKKLYPSTYSIGKISASVDGLTADGSTAWEHKQYNKEYFDMVSRGEVPEEHMPQCQQVLMVTGADKLIFTISDGTQENMVSTTVTPRPDWFEKIRATWAQFEIDLANYVLPEVVDKPEPDAIMQLPTVIARATGTIAACNLEEVAPRYDLFIVNADARLATIDIINGTAIAKFSRAAAAELIESEKRLIAEISPLDELSKRMKLYAAKLNKIGLEYEKAVDRMKKAEAEAVFTHIQSEYDEYVESLHQAINPIRLVLEKKNFPLAIKSLKTPESKNAALNAALANAKTEAKILADGIAKKLNWFDSNHKQNALLFPDLQGIIYKPFDDFKLLVESRINQHNAAEEARRLAEREQIRIEEEAKATAKAQAEALSKAQADAAAQKAIDDKARAENGEAARLKRIQDDLDNAKAITKANEEKRVTDQATSPTLVGTLTPSYSVLAAPIPTDAQIISAIMLAFNVTKGTACDWILSVAENMKVAA